MQIIYMLKFSKGIKEDILNDLIQKLNELNLKCEIAGKENLKYLNTSYSKINIDKIFSVSLKNESFTEDEIERIINSLLNEISDKVKIIEQGYL